VILPSILALSSICIYYSLKIKPPLFGNNGFIPYISEILKFLSPFYIASLAAVSTFQGDSITGKMKGDPLTIRTKKNGKSIIMELNRRQFLSLMFGYLSLLSLFLYFLGYISAIFASNLNLVINNIYHNILKTCFILIYLFAFYNLITTTMLGLFYLSEKIHEID
jgi:hypothetical protein